jgi:seryl-tRNA synthetase
MGKVENMNEYLTTIKSYLVEKDKLNMKLKNEFKDLDAKAKEIENNHEEIITAMQNYQQQSRPMSGPDTPSPLMPHILTAGSKK